MTTVKTTTAITYSRPVVPPLYFEKHAQQTGTPTAVAAAKINNKTAAPHIPTEIFTRCVEFCDWGDLAKLACVRSSWTGIVNETANSSSQSKWELAQALLNGHCGLQPNPTKAVTLLQELAQVPVDGVTGKPITDKKEQEEGNAEDDVNIDNININSVTTAATSTTTLSCFGPAIRQLADCYLDGVGVERNPECALAWLEASFVVGGDADAAHEVALIQEYGRHGIEVDVVAAVKWFEKAAEAGHVESMAELGLCYELGCGVEQSDELALDWYTKAANLGHATAKFSVGEAFEEARGVPQSDHEACLWYYRAALAGDVDSKKALRRLYDIARTLPGVADILRE